MTERAPEVTLTWDGKNWLTILLMVALGLGGVILLAQVVRQGPSLFSKVNLSPSGSTNAPSLS